MIISYETCDKDYIDFYEFNAKNTEAGKKALKTQILTVPVILALIFIATILLNAKLLVLLIQIPIYVFLSWSWRGVQYSSLRKTASGIIIRMKRKGQCPYSESGKLSFGDKEILDERKSGTLTLHYSDISAVYENNGAVYIYMDAERRVILLSAKNLEENSRDELLGFLKSKVAPEKMLLSASE